MPDLTPEQKNELLGALDKGLEASAAFAGASAEEMNFAASLPANQPSNDVVPDDVPAPPADHPDATPAAGVTHDDEEAPGDGTPPADPAQPSQPAAPAEPAQPAAPAPDAAAAADPAVAPPADAAAAPPADDDAKLSSSLKGRAKERFEELTGQVREFAPLREELTKLGVKSVDDLTKMQERAAWGEDMVSTVMETGADAEQYGQALQYLTTFNEAARTGDPVKAKAALEMLAPAVQRLSALAGVDPSAVIGDPLDAVPELKLKVDNGDITRADALTLVSAQTTRTLAEARSRNEASVDAQQRAVTTARDGLIAWDQEQMTADPVGYGARRAALNVQVAQIRASLPPDKWLQATRNAYDALKLIPVAAPTPAATARPATPPGHTQGNGRTLPRMGAVRSSGSRPPMAKEFKDPMEALSAGLDAAFGIASD